MFLKFGFALLSIKIEAAWLSSLQAHHARIGESILEPHSSRCRCSDTWIRSCLDPSGLNYTCIR